MAELPTITVSLEEVAKHTRPCPSCGHKIVDLTAALTNSPEDHALWQNPQIAHAPQCAFCVASNIYVQEGLEGL